MHADFRRARKRLTQSSLIGREKIRGRASKWASKLGRADQVHWSAMLTEAASKGLRGGRVR
jgi:hypothetical protein